jgi:hypothetical protein
VWANREFLRVMIHRAIVNPSAQTVINKALILVRATLVSDRMKQSESRVTIERGLARGRLTAPADPLRSADHRANSSEHL